MIDMWIKRVILASACYARDNIDVDTACYLKCDDGTKCMRSDCVTALARQAIAWDWRTGIPQRKEETGILSDRNWT
jgi:hypothetical protein